MNIYYVIPARKGSKGLPNKNRILLQYTIQKIPEDYYSNVIITTDDEEIKNQCGSFRVIDRPGELANDTANIRDVLIHASQGMREKDLIVMLYLPYPEREWNEVLDAIDFFVTYKCKSMLCRKEVMTHPYLCVYESGKQVVKHDLYRRQDYPKCYEISHYIAIAIVEELHNLNKNLYNIDTFYYDIQDVIDVDTEEDLKRYEDSISNLDG